MYWLMAVNSSDSREFSTSMSFLLPFIVSSFVSDHRSDGSFHMADERFPPKRGELKSIDNALIFMKL
jgi:hypothetical protein